MSFAFQLEVGWDKRQIKEEDNFTDRLCYKGRSEVE